MVRASVPRWIQCVVPLLVTLVTVTAFLPVLQNQFVRWDDQKNLFENTRYRGLAWTQLRWMWTTFHMGHYIPLTWMTLGLDYLLWGMNPLGYHLTSLALHATNAVVFYFVVLRILPLALPSSFERDQPPAVSAGVAALVFAVHPLRVESVVWATERRDVLSGLFYLMTIVAYLRACERNERGRGCYWLSVVLFGSALLSKSMAVSLPAVLVILDIYPLRRLGGSIGWWSESAQRVYAEKIPFVLLAGAASFIAFMAQFSTPATATLAQLSVPSRLAVSAYGLSFYLWKMVVPWNLSPLYPLPLTVNPWATPFILSYGLVFAITAIVVVLRSRLPGLSAAWATYVVVLLPVIGIFQNGPQIAADRYTYLASLGWAILAVAGLVSGWQIVRTSTHGIATFSLAGLATCAVVALGVLTWNQVRIWRDTETLWTHAVRVDPNSAIAHFNLGMALGEQDRPPEAIEHFRETLRLEPDYPSAESNWATELAQQGKLAEAIEHFQQALRANPKDALGHTSWGAALVDQGKPTEAIAHFREALRLEVDDPRIRAIAHTNWAGALIAQGQVVEAIEHYREALRIAPGLAAAQNGLGQALAQEGQRAEAKEHYQHAQRLKGVRVE
jgi:protein O-mannosyl-transferase